MSLIDVFRKAERFVKYNYSDDLKDVYYFLNINPDEISKEFFFRQYTHVVYCSGFRWAVVKEKWPQLQEAYYDFDYIKVNWNREQVKKAAQKIINHKAKINAMLEMAATLSEWNQEYFKSYIQLAKKNIDAFEGLPYIGKVTKYHLGICMGFNVIKPDTHIQRLADHYRLSPFEMCETLSNQTGHPIRIIDAILWRASEQKAINVSGEALK